MGSHTEWQCPLARPVRSGVYRQEGRFLKGAAKGQGRRPCYVNERIEKGGSCRTATRGIRQR